MQEEERKESGDRKQQVHNKGSLTGHREKPELTPTLSTTDNWILLTHPLGAKNKSQPPLKESLMIARAEGKCSPHKEWWREGKDELDNHPMTTEVWISTRGRIPEATRIALQKALEEDNKKRHSLLWKGRPRGNT